VVTGHFPLCTAEILGGGYTTLTVVREPIERILSHLHHHRARTPDDRDKSLEEIYSDPRSSTGWCATTWSRCSRSRPRKRSGRASCSYRGCNPRRVHPERLKRAKAGLASVDAVGLYERIDEFFDELTSRFGWDLGPPQHEMRVDQLAKRELDAEVSDSFRARIVEDNAMDVELYRFAQRL
jgi:hypothetical protein